jgi:ATP synthase protein I
MSESEPPDRLAQLGRRLDAARARRGDSQPAAGSGDPALQQGMAVGLRIGVEFVVTIALATAVGWALDRWLGIGPWGMIVLFFLGIGAGMASVYRAVAGIRVPVGYRPPETLDPGRQRAKDKWDEE